MVGTLDCRKQKNNKSKILREATFDGTQHSAGSLDSDTVALATTLCCLVPHARVSEHADELGESDR